MKSSHKFVSTTLSLDEIKRGPGTWKLNNKLLENLEYVQEMRQLLESLYVYQTVLDPSDFWSFMKKRITEFSREFSKKVAHIRNKQKVNLTKLNELLTAEFNSGSYDSILLEELDKTNKELDEIALDETRSIIFRSKAKWVREGEKNSKFFFALEKKKYLSKNMASMLVDGKLITDQDSILDEQVKFYGDLYQSNASIQFNLTRSPNDPTITEDDKKSTESPITLDELFDAIMTLKSDKTPGMDGLTIEFYRKFWKNLSPALYAMYNDAFSKGVLPLSTRRGLISLLPKKNKDTRIIKNLRPLTLLNNDYKILAKTIDNRISPLLPKIINSDETGFVKGRNISYNIRKSLDVMEYCKSNKILAVIMSCDMNKCFDRIEHQAVYGALCLFGFGEDLIQWVSLFYSKFQICTQNYGFLSDWMDKTRGCNQGCPLSPSAFLCVREIMANCLRNNPKIHGIKIKEIEYLLSQFADDTDMYLPYDADVINAVLRTLTDIEQNTGLMISYEKTTLYRIGSIANSDAKCYTTRPVQWTNEVVNTLGIYLYGYKNISHNLDDAFNKLKVICKMWYYRSLTLVGKVLIVNTLMSSLFVYKFQCINNIPDSMYELYENTITDFIWEGKRAKIPLTTLYCDHVNGGLKLCNIRYKHASLLCKWVSDCYKDKSIANLAATNICTFNNEIWKYNLNCSDFKKCTSYGNNNFWDAVGAAWSKIFFFFFFFKVFGGHMSFFGAIGTPVLDFW